MFRRSLVNLSILVSEELAECLLDLHRESVSDWLPQLAEAGARILSLLNVPSKLNGFPTTSSCDFPDA